MLTLSKRFDDKSETEEGEEDAIQFLEAEEDATVALESSEETFDLVPLCAARAIIAPGSTRLDLGVRQSTS